MTEIKKKFASTAVIGVGNLGIRHLESLVTTNTSSLIYAVDSSMDSLQAAQKAYDEIPVLDKPQLITLNDLSELPKSIDFAIIATNSLVRSKIVSLLLNHSKVKYLLLEKFLFPTLEEYDIVNQILSDTGTSAWVNCPRRMFPFYRQLKDAVKRELPLVMLANAGNLSVGTHAIHFIDLFSFLLSDIAIQKIDLSLLHKKVYHSKRDGYIEFKGTIIATAGNSTFVFQTYEEGKMPLQIIINQADRRTEVLEHESIIRFSTSDDGWKMHETPMHKPMQSQLTGVVAQQLIERGDCDLPQYSVSAHLHRQLLEALLQFMNEELNLSTSICNIT